VLLADDYPYGTPGNVCYLCGCSPRTKFQGRKEKVIDCEKMIDFEGYLCICETCIEHAAEMLGMLTKRKSEITKAKSEELVQENADLRMQLGAAMDALNALRSLDAIYAPEPATNAS
jgi:hypothetical protein